MILPILLQGLLQGTLTYAPSRSRTGVLGILCPIENAGIGLHVVICYPPKPSLQVRCSVITQ
jgi:hypothetical protein